MIQLALIKPTRIIPSQRKFPLCHCVVNKFVKLSAQRWWLTACCNDYYVIFIFYWIQIRQYTFLTLLKVGVWIIPKIQ